MFKSYDAYIIVDTLIEKSTIPNKMSSRSDKYAIGGGRGRRDCSSDYDQRGKNGEGQVESRKVESGKVDMEGKHVCVTKGVKKDYILENYKGTLRAVCVYDLSAQL